MKFELSIYELSKVLKELEKTYNLNMLIKQTLSGGWITISGTAIVESEAIQGAGCHGKDINILEIKITTNNDEGSIVKITGSKNKKFIVDIAATRYMELSPSILTMNKIKVNENECKLRIDEDVIFTINSSVDNVVNIIESQINS